MFYFLQCFRAISIKHTSLRSCCGQPVKKFGQLWSKPSWARWRDVMTAWGISYRWRRPQWSCPFVMAPLIDELLLSSRWTHSRWILGFHIWTTGLPAVSYVRPFQERVTIPPTCRRSREPQGRPVFSSRRPGRTFIPTTTAQCASTL